MGESSVLSKAVDAILEVLDDAGKRKADLLICLELTITKGNVAHAKKMVSERIKEN